MHMPLSLQQRFILASISPRRLDLVRKMGIEPEKIVAPDIDETPLGKELPQPLCIRLAKQKALKVKQEYPDHCVLAADTVVGVGRRILGKPLNRQEAERFLQLLSGRRHDVYTGLCVIAADGKTVCRVTHSRVQFKKLSAQEVECYLKGDEWEGKAGGYGIQGQAEMFIKSINGSYTNVVGLPLCETYSLLVGMGIVKVI